MKIGFLGFDNCEGTEKGRLWFWLSMIKVNLYHSSPFLFDRFSNKFHYTGYGRMAAGWGIYFTNSIDFAFIFHGNPFPVNYVWLIDGTKVYNEYVNNVHYLKEDLFDSILDFRKEMTYDNYHQKNWKQNLLDLFKEDEKSETAIDWWDEFDLKKRDRYRPLSLQKLKDANEVKLQAKTPYYIYTVEINARKILHLDRPFSEGEVKRLNKQLRREKANFELPAFEPGGGYGNSFYWDLHKSFERRYKFSKKDILKETSLFLYRAGYDLMDIANGHEYVLFDTSKTKIVAVEKIGG